MFDLGLFSLVAVIGLLVFGLHKAQSEVLRLQQVCTRRRAQLLESERKLSRLYRAARAYADLHQPAVSMDHGPPMSIVLPGAQGALDVLRNVLAENETGGVAQ